MSKKYGITTVHGSLPVAFLYTTVHSASKLMDFLCFKSRSGIQTNNRENIRLITLQLHTRIKTCIPVRHSSLQR